MASRGTPNGAPKWRNLIDPDQFYNFCSGYHYAICDRKLAMAQNASRFLWLQQHVGVLQYSLPSSRDSRVVKVLA